MEEPEEEVEEAEEEVEEVGLFRKPLPPAAAAKRAGGEAAAGAARRATSSPLRGFGYRDAARFQEDSAFPSIPFRSIRNVPALDRSSFAIHRRSSFTGFYLVLLGCTEFYWVLPSLAGFCWVLLGFTGLYWVLHSKKNPTLRTISC